MEKTCLITGGAGFIGSAVSNYLTQEYSQIIALDNFHPQIHPQARRPEFLSKQAEIYQADVCNRHDWDVFFRRYKPETILHFAAETGTGQSLTESYLHTNVNISGLGQMLDAIVRSNSFPRKIVLTSSRAVYGEGRWVRNDHNIYYPNLRTKQQLVNKQWDFLESKYLPSDCTTTLTHPSNVYGVTKVAQEQLLDVWCRAFDVDYSIMRLQNVYGPGQSLYNSYTGIVTLFGRIAKSGESIPLYEDGDMLRDFVYIDDVANAILQVTKKKDLDRKIYDIGSGRACSVKDMAKIIAGIYDAPAPHICQEYRLGDVRHAACSIAKANEELDWWPKHRLEDGLYNLCSWIDDQMDNETNAV